MAGEAIQQTRLARAFLKQRELDAHNEYANSSRNIKATIMMNSNYTDNLEDNKEDLNKLKPDLNLALQFLMMLSQCDESDAFTFQIFPERKSSSASYAKVLHGSLEELGEALIKDNLKGSGIFVTVNRTDGKGRKNINIIGIRSVFVDLDGAPLKPILDSPLSPHMVIESSPGRYHAYWVIKDLAIDEFTPIQKALAAQFGGDPKICDLSRVMRLPGFYHQKHIPYQTTIIKESSELPYNRDNFLITFGIKEDKDTFEARCEINHQDPVVEELKRNRLLIRAQGHPSGCWLIECPWRHLHTKQDLGTKYFEPNASDYPVGGFKCFHAHCGNKTLKDLLAYLGIQCSIVSEPLSLHRPLDVPKPFPFEALGSILMPAALAMQRVIQAPDAICAQSVLGAAALTCQPFANIFMDGRVIPLSIFLITVAESGERKSATDKIALKPIYAWQKMLDDAFKEENKKYIRSQELWECKRKEWMKNTSQGPFTDEMPCSPLHPLILVEEPTYEGIVKYLAIGQPSIGLFSDEGARFFGGHAMSRDNQLKTIAGLSSLWDGKEISRLRAGDGNMLLYGRRVSLHLMIQEIILEELMRNEMIKKQGFLPRCLISFPESTTGKRSYVEEDITKDQAICKYYDQLNLLLDKKLPINPFPAPQNELKPLPITLTGAAKKEWITYHDCIDLDSGLGKRLEPIRRLSNKAAEHVLRLAGNLQIIDLIETDQIDVEYIQKGIRLVEYYLEESMRIQGCLSIHPDLVLSQRLLDWLYSKEKDLFSLQEIYQYGPPQIRQASKARSIMMILEKHGWAKSTPGVEVEGRLHKEAWVIKRPHSC